MWSIAGIAVLAIAIWIVTFRDMKKHGAKRDRFAFIILLVIAVTACILRILRLPLPNPAAWIDTMFTPVSEWLDQLFT